MPRPSQRPTTARQKSRSNNGIPRQSKQTQEISLPEDDDDFRPRSRKKRSKEQNKKSDSKKREHFEEALNEMADELAGAIEDDSREGKKAVSVFQKDFKQLREQLSPDNLELRVDQTSASFYRAALAMLTDLVPIAERTYRQTQKESAAYALAALINQIRDLNNDVKLSEDVEGRLIIIRQLVKSGFVRIADFLLREKYGLHHKIDALTADGRLRKAFRNELDAMIIEFGKGMFEYQNLLISQISLYLMGDPSYLNPSTGGESSADAPRKKKKSSKRKSR